MKKLIKEPLVHFLLFGGLVFLYYQSVAPKNTVAIQKKAITFTQYDIKELQNDFYQKTHRQPTKNELDLLVENVFLQDVLLSEAYALGLEKEDEQIKKRLLSKMELLLNQKTFQEPNEIQLENYYKAHGEDYSEKKRLSFVVLHVLSKELSEQLRQAVWFLPLEKLPLIKFENQTPQQIEDRFGRLARQKILALPKKTWSGPVYTKEGMVLVYILKYDKLGKKLPFDRVEYRVYNDYVNHLHQTNKKARLKKILSRYELDYEN